MTTAKTTLETFVTPNELREVILDFESYPSMIREVERVEVHARSDDAAEVTFHFDISFGGFESKSHYRIRYEIGETRIAWELVESPTLVRNRGSWTLEETEDEECLAHYEAEVETNMPIPPEVQAAFVEQQLPKLMEAFRDRAEE